MLRLLKQNPLHFIVQNQQQFLHPKPIGNGAASNPQTILFPFTISRFSSSACNIPSESPKSNEPIFDFFHSYGFADTQIKKFLHNSRPYLSPETMNPNVDHLLAFGLLPSELVRIINGNPRILSTNLKERIEPNLKLLEATIGSKTLIIKAINSCSWLLTDNVEKRLIPNFNLLRENSIPTDSINRLFTKFPRVLLKEPSVIIESIRKLKGLGMSPSTLAFVYGMNVMATFKKETWERKMELYRSFGWSEKDTLSVFSTKPSCLAISDDKIKEKMKFFTEKLQWNSAILAKQPVFLLYSLEGRIMPRCAVLSVLAKRKLWEGNPNLFSLFYMSEKKFKGRFVEKHEKEVPQVIDAYQGKIDFVGFELVDG